MLESVYRQVNGRNFATGNVFQLTEAWLLDIYFRYLNARRAVIAFR